MSPPRRKLSPRPLGDASFPRPLAPSDRRSPLPTALALRALLGVGIAIGGLAASGCKKPLDGTSDGEKVTADEPRKPATTTSVTAAPSESAPCAASEHVEPHIPPNADNDIGGKMVAVKPTPAPTVKPVIKPGATTSGATSTTKPKCPPGDPLCA